MDWSNAFSVKALIMAISRKWGSSSRSALLICLVIAGSFYAALALPASAGMENGFIENVQVCLLLLGGLWCIFRWRNCRTPRWKAFWLMLGPLWFILVFRELSWGTVFLEPLEISETLGPLFSSSKQLWYKPVVAPAIGLILVFSFFVFVRTRQYLSFKELAKNDQLPLLALVMCVLFMIVSIAAEGHLRILMSMTSGATQVFEELMEFWSYLALLFAQYRVMQTSSR